MSPFTINVVSFYEATRRQTRSDRYRTLRVRSLAEPHKVLSADSVLYVLLFSSTRSSYGKRAFVSSADMKNTFNKAPFFKAEITLVIPHVVRNLYFIRG